MRRCGAIQNMMASVSTTQQRVSSSIRNHRYNPVSQQRAITAPLSSQQRFFHSTNATTAPASSTIKPWPVDVVESHGDYRDEVWIEHHVGGKLYEIQNNNTLPRLPVCTIASTLEKFIPTALPLAHNSTEQTNLQAAVTKFPSQAASLQERLQQRATDPKTTSWLQQWWNTWCYLQVRDSIVINVSYFFHFVDDPTLPVVASNSSATTGSTNTTTNYTRMIARAATLLTGVGQFRKLLASGELDVETIGKKGQEKALCATAYKYMLNACRIPQLEQDSYKIYDPSKYHHVILAIENTFYEMQLIDPNTSLPYPIHQLENAIQRCIEMNNNNNNASLLELGWCTSSNRDDWAKARNQLIRVGGIDMENALQRLESGAILLCLDIHETTSISKSEIAQVLLHGRSSKGGTASAAAAASGGNRWFDKSIQLIVTATGKAGLVGEHSMMDGMPTVRLADYITKTTYRSTIVQQQPPQQSAAPSPQLQVQPIFSSQLIQKVQSTAIPLIEKAKNDFHQLVSQNSLHVQSFQGYGSTFMKQAGYSPDAYVQVAIQLATYRLWSEQAGTYEATQVRPFLHGRTETTRSVSTESAAFVHAMGLRPAYDEHVDSIRHNKLQLLKDATSAHVKYIGYASQAQGVDRHFLGLSMLVQDGETLPDLYNDPVFQRSKRWRVSTSHLTHPKFENWGYGQVVPDGVGLAYSIHPRHCMFNITALQETGWTDQLAHLLEEALLEMRALVEMEQQATSTTTPKSKL